MVVICGRENHCGQRISARELFPDLFDNFTQRYPATEADPDASARAYLLHGRGFRKELIEGLYHQGTLRAGDGTQVETVRFPLWGNQYWERVIDADGARRAGKKARFSHGSNIKDRHWQLPDMVLNRGDPCYIVEGIFHVIALAHAGRKAVAAFSCNQFPAQFVEEHKGKGIEWRVAYDNGPAGRKWARDWKEHLKKMGETARIHLAYSDHRDWDECFRRGEFDRKEFWNDCRYRGQLLEAGDPTEYAWRKHRRKPTGYRLIRFDNQTYVFRCPKKTTGDGFEGLEEEIAGLDEERSLEIYRELYEGDRILNCSLQFMHFEEDELTGELRYRFLVSYPGEYPDQWLSVDGGVLETPAALNRALLTRTRFCTFDGGSGDLRALIHKFRRRAGKTVRIVPFVGYDQDTETYIYQAFGIRKGRIIELNEAGYLDLGRKLGGIKTGSVDFNPPCTREYDPWWFRDFVTVFDRMGIVTLGAWLGTLFVQQIRQKYESWPFVELTGDPGAGKSTLFLVLWKLLGRRDNSEGFDPNRSSMAGRRRHFQKGRNWPLVLIESDRNKDANANHAGKFDFNELKPLYDAGGVLAALGIPQRGATTIDPVFGGAVFIAQNEEVTGSDALMERIVRVHASKGHKRRENASKALALRMTPLERLSGFLVRALQQEAGILARFDEGYPKWKRYFINGGEIGNDRLIHNHALIMAAVESLALMVPIGQDQIDEIGDYVYRLARDRHERLLGDPPIVALFWESFDHLESIGIELNCSDKEDELWINLPEVHSVAEANRLPRLDPVELRRQLPLSRTRPLLPDGINKSLRCRRKIATGQSGKTVRVWKFKR